MSLGERIYRLRTEKNLSQGALAEMLDVSRQSISKWENNSAIPDLEKIVKLSEIFGVSLDELVKGEEKLCGAVSDNIAPKPQKQEAGFPPRKIAGTILLCMAFLVIMFLALMGGFLAGLIFALPFLACGIICFVFRRNVGLWCAWAVYVLVDIYMSYATGIDRASVLFTFQWTQQMNYMRLAFAWVLVISLVVMIAITVIRFGKLPLSTEKKGCNRVIVAWAVVILLQVIAMIWPRTEMYSYILANIFSMEVVYRLITILLSWSRIIAVTIALVDTLRLVRGRKIKA